MVECIVNQSNVLQWRCDLDFDFERYCLPKYTFRVLGTDFVVAAAGRKFQLMYSFFCTMESSMVTEY